MGKLVIWIFTLIGLAPSIAVAMASLSMLLVARRMSQLRYTASTEVYLHDSYFEIGGWRIGMTPQYWSVALLFLGIIMIVVALAALLRS